eukprot:6186089-Pleurochrysis_carterae.AAC.1
MISASRIASFHARRPSHRVSRASGGPCDCFACNLRATSSVSSADDSTRTSRSTTLLEIATLRPNEALFGFYSFCIFTSDSAETAAMCDFGVAFRRQVPRALSQAVLMSRADAAGARIARPRDLTKQINVEYL